MEKITKRNASIQLSCFLNSKISREYPLDAKDILILTHICFYIDAGKNVCFVRYEKLAMLCRMPIITLRRRIKKLLNLGLIEKRRGRNNAFIWLGEVLITC